MNILDRLNSGTLHAKAREERPDCVDAKGNIHGTPVRATFVSWMILMESSYGGDIATWPKEHRDEYRARYVPSH